MPTTEVNSKQSYLSYPFSKDASEVAVVAAVIRDENNRILVAKRPDHLHQGGLWEFPGGKIESGESLAQALVRELREEVNLEALSFRPLMEVAHQYPDKKVRLYLYLVDQTSGQAKGNEGQEVRWVQQSDLASLTFPAANTPILKAIALPDLYLITAGWKSEAEYVERIRGALQAGVRCIQLRMKQVDLAQYQRLVNTLMPLFEAVDGKLILNAPAEWFEALQPKAVHLTSGNLMRCQSRPVPDEVWLSASCHNEEQLAQAQKIKADCLLLSPVLATSSHPDATPLGWEEFHRLTRDIQVPVYALGGMEMSMLATAWDYGAQGVAGISSFWKLWG